MPNIKESDYLDRVLSPDQTFDRVAQSFARLGITRIADQTGLDRIGIPCFAAFRPNAASLANNQGKGVSRQAAKVSAAMEAAEFSIAENPPIQTNRTTELDLKKQNKHIIDIRYLLPIGEELSPRKSMEWATGYCVLSGQEAFVPKAALTISNHEPELPTIAKSTNGLSSGNTREEALFHGLCELIERDASTLWSLQPEIAQQETGVSPASFDDPEVSRMAQKIENAGLVLRLFDQTSDIDVPCIMAVIGDNANDDPKHFDLAAGCGAHPNAARAAIRAITEAAQTRVTSIAGSRDDINPLAYRLSAAEGHKRLLNFDPCRENRVSGGLRSKIQLDQLLAYTKKTLATAGVTNLYCIPLNGDEFKFAAVKVIAPELEDREVNTNWRPKARALEIVFAT